MRYVECSDCGKSEAAREYILSEMGWGEAIIKVNKKSFHLELCPKHNNEKRLVDLIKKKLRREEHDEN